jgi:two-component system response regulator YesN
MLKLMVVDDEENVRYVVECLVKKSNLGIELVCQASDGDEGLEKFAQLKSDIVVADIRMPGMDGLEMLRRIKLVYPAVEIVVISGYSDFAYAQTALQNGALAYLLKPIDEEEFYEALSKASARIEKRRNEQAKLNKLELTIRKLQSDIIQNELPAQENIATCASVQFKKALAYLHENFARDISLEQTANHVFMSPAYLSDLCKKHLGRAFIDYLNHLRVQKAQLLLEKTGLRVYEIASLVGFCEVSYFIRVFRKYSGMSPTEYRKSCNSVR